MKHIVNIAILLSDRDFKPEEFYLLQFEIMAEEVEAHVLKRYTLVKKVGSGAYGHVWKVTDRKTGETLALKKIFDAFQHSTDAQRTFREITLLHELDHPNIIRLQQVIRAENDKDLYLVFEFMEADLHNAIGQKILKDAHHRFILYQLVRALKFLHSAQVIHRDLKPSNLLLNSDCTLKICDFGLARSLVADISSHDMVLTEEVATRWYRAPQVLLGSHTYDKSADIWSVGCILAQMFLGKPIFPGNSTLNQLERILHFTGKPCKEDIDSLQAEGASTMIDQALGPKPRSSNDYFRPDVNAEAVQLIQRMLQFNPAKRPTAAQILRSPYLVTFAKPKADYDCKKTVRPPISDNTKLNLKDYRMLIYEHIKKVYHKEQPQPGFYEFEAKKVERPNTAGRHEATEGILRTNSSSNTKPKTSEGKVFHYGKASLSASCHDEDHVKKAKNNFSCHDEDPLKKKNSLKEILKNKRPSLAPYRAAIDKHNASNPYLRKYTREGDGALYKENKVIHAWEKK